MIMPKIVNLFSNKIKKKKNYKTRFTVIKETKGKKNTVRKYDNSIQKIMGKKTYLLYHSILFFYLSN